MITISSATVAPTIEPAADPWSALDRELSAWADAGRAATFWWRDDDAVRPTPALDRLLSLSGRHGVPVALAVIPAFVEDGLARRLDGDMATVLQHGWAHANHAPDGEKKAELGDHRPPGAIGEELRRGADRLRTLFGGRFLPVLTPPWNRIGAETAAALPGWGYAGLSTFGPRKAAGDGIARVNTHADIIDWRGDRDFAGDRAVLDAACRHLSARRAGTADPDEPTGLLTHHLDHDAESWDFIDRLLSWTRSHPAVSWRSAATLFDNG